MKYLLAVLLLPLIGQANAQSEQLTLAKCYELARENYPEIAKLKLIAQSAEFDIEHANKAYLPQVNFSALASYGPYDVKSDQANIDFTNSSIGMQASVNQTIYNGGQTRYQKQKTRAEAELNAQSVEVNLYHVKHRVNELYFAILLMDAQLAQNKVNSATIETQVAKMEASVANGVALQNMLDELKAELLHMQMRQTEYETSKAGYLQMLSLFIGEEVNNSQRLMMPETIVNTPSFNKRPEMQALELQRNLINIQQRQLRSSYTPTLSAYANGGASLIDAKLSGLGINQEINGQMTNWSVGARLNWSLSGLYNNSAKRKKMAIQAQLIDVDKQSFLRAANLDLTKEKENINKYKLLLAQDDEMISLRASVVQAAEAQLEHGVITMHEYIQKANAEHLARENKILHQIQLLQAQYKQGFIGGSY